MRISECFCASVLEEPLRGRNPSAIVRIAPHWICSVQTDSFLTPQDHSAGTSLYSSTFYDPITACKGCHTTFILQQDIIAIRFVLSALSGYQSEETACRHLPPCKRFPLACTRHYPHNDVGITAPGYQPPHHTSSPPSLHPSLSMGHRVHFEHDQQPTAVA